jgi:chromosome segregation ATPase
MKDHNHQRLDDAIARRNRAAQKVQKLRGRLDAARETVAEIEEECSERGVPPEKLDAAINQLQKRYDSSVAAFEKHIDEAEAQLAPFMGGP